jgi:hypothetical protein
MCPYPSVVRNRTRKMYPYSMTTLEFGYVCLVGYWLHWSTDTFVLYCSWLHWSTDTFVLSCIWLHWSTDTFVLYSSVVRNRTRQMYPYSSVVRNRTRQMYQYSSVVRNRTRQMCPYFSGVRIHLSCRLLTTLEYGYICLVCYWLHWSTDTFVL